MVWAQNLYDKKIKNLKKTLKTKTSTFRGFWFKKTKKKQNLKNHLFHQCSYVFVAVASRESWISQSHYNATQLSQLGRVCLYCWSWTWSIDGVMHSWEGHVARLSHPLTKHCVVRSTRRPPILVSGDALLVARISKWLNQTCSDNNVPPDFGTNPDP